MPRGSVRFIAANHADSYDALCAAMATLSISAQPVKWRIVSTRHTQPASIE
jgi:hypothetical protein